MVPIIDPYLTAYYGASKCQVNNIWICVLCEAKKVFVSGTCKFICWKKNSRTTILISFLPYLCFYIHLNYCTLYITLGVIETHYIILIFQLSCFSSIWYLLVIAWSYMHFIYGIHTYIQQMFIKYYNTLADKYGPWHDSVLRIYAYCLYVKQYVYDKTINNNLVWISFCFLQVCKKNDFISNLFTDKIYKP